MKLKPTPTLIESAYDEPYNPKPPYTAYGELRMLVLEISQQRDILALDTDEEKIKAIYQIAIKKYHNELQGDKC